MDYLEHGFAPFEAFRTEVRSQIDFSAGTSILSKLTTDTQNWVATQLIAQFEDLAINTSNNCLLCIRHIIALKTPI